VLYGQYRYGKGPAGKKVKNAFSLLFKQRPARVHKMHQRIEKCFGQTNRREKRRGGGLGGGEGGRSEEWR